MRKWINSADFGGEGRIELVPEGEAFAFHVDFERPRVAEEVESRLRGRFSCLGGGRF